MAENEVEVGIPVSAEGLDQDWLRKCSDMGADRLHRYKDAEMYYDGEQPTYLTDRAKEFLERNSIPYNENFCETVVDAMVERLAIVGISCESVPVGDWLWTTWWDRNRGDLLQMRLYLEAAKKGDAFLVLDWDASAGLVMASLNQPEIVRPFYDSQRRLQYVSKVWKDVLPDEDEAIYKSDPILRMNLFWPDRIEKYWCETKDGDKALWMRWEDEGDTAWPVKWTGADGKPIGIPVFHFANKARSSGFGRAEHWGTIAQQNRLNKELLDLAMVLDQQGFPQRHVTGIDDTSSLKNVPGEVWSTANTDADFGQFEAAQPDGLLKAIEATMVRIATRSNTPIHRFLTSGGWPSGEALKVSEAGLVAKVDARQVEWGGGTWVDVLRMVVSLQKTFAPEDAIAPMPKVEDPDTLSINVAWMDPESRNEKEHLEALAAMAGLGVSKDTLLSMIPGIDPARERIKKATEDRQAAARQAEMMAQGVIPSGGPGGFGRPPQQQADREPALPR
jgi:hypothetical protein